MRQRSLLLAVFFVAVLAGCAKKDDPAPDPDDFAARIAGTYQVSKLTLNTQVLTLPQQGLSASLKLTKKGTLMNEVIYLLTFNNNGATESGTGEFQLFDSGADVDIYEDGIKRGIWSNNTINLSILTDDGLKLVIVAKK
ncbi:MAG: hypothetical protein LH606_20020 [Cytophagaceae bacterium]|nr:hypothetical protein [Cytophagaceae bacterium]